MVESRRYHGELHPNDDLLIEGKVAPDESAIAGDFILVRVGQSGFFQQFWLQRKVLHLAAEVIIPTKP